MTGQGARRTTRSATLPRSKCGSPVRPWVPMTMRSTCLSPGDFDDPVSRHTHLRECLNSHVGILDMVLGYPQLLIGLSLQFCHVGREASLGGAGKVKMDHVQESQASPKLPGKRDGVFQGMIGI